jgi:hypothetical protein
LSYVGGFPVKIGVLSVQIFQIVRSAPIQNVCTYF